MVRLFIFLISSICYAQQDKQLHAVAGGITSAITYNLVKEKKLLYSIGSAIAIGALKEVYDVTRGGKFDTKDILASALGGVTATLTFEIFKSKNNKNVVQTEINRKQENSI